MIKNLYSIKDRLQGFMSPFYDVNDEIAMRNFDSAAQKNDIIWFNPDEFSLYRLGSYNDESGLLVSEPTPVFLMQAIDHKKDGEKNE